MIEGINQIKKEIHENVVAHGWWEENLGVNKKNA